MTVSLWRIATDTPSYTADDVSGAGAVHAPGRWHDKGTPMLYCASSRSLACLETLVHQQGSSNLPFNRYLVEFRVPADVWKNAVQFDVTNGVGWDALPAGMVSTSWGTQWVKSLASVAAQVPSIVIPEEWNILLNPHHPDMSKIKVKKIRRWTYDPRFFGAKF